MTRAVYCTLVRTPDMKDSLRPASSGGFEDLVPWADPYIAALIEKLRRDHARGEEDEQAGMVGELAPPLDNGDKDQDAPWQADWSPRNWPRG